MKRIWIIFLTAVLLCGCGAKETMETVADEYLQPVMVEKQQLMLDLPEEAASAASDTGAEVYFCQNYEIIRETRDSGDLNRTLKALTGFDRAHLTVLETGTDDCRRYEFVWTSAGENGDRLGRGMILDDGNFHYCLSVLADAEDAQNRHQVWEELFTSAVLG